MARKGLLCSTFTLPDGTRKYVYAKTKEELEAKVFDLRLQLKMGVDLSDKTTVGELIKLWYVSEVEPKIKENTALNLKCIINKHLMPLVATCVAKDVTPIQVKLWINETGKLNKNAAKTCLRALKGAFELAEENGLVYRSPVLSRYKPGGVPYKKREALTPVEEEQLLDAVEGSRVYLFCWFGLATGARRGEACGLMWDCVDLENAVVHLRRNLVFVDQQKTDLRDYMKTESGTRDIPLPLDLRDALREEKRVTNSVFVFHRPDGRPYNATSFAHMWNNVTNRFGPNAKQTARTHGVITDTAVTPHVLRHTYATRCFESGMDIKEVQYLMGHANPTVTLDIYTHYCKSSRQDETFDKARTARQRTTPVPQESVQARVNEGK